MTTNGISNGHQVPVNGSTSGWDPSVRDQIIMALMQNGGLKRIQSTLRQRLDEAGWSQDLKEYCIALFRSGAATTYDDALTIIMRRINSGDDEHAANPEGVPAPNLAIPHEAKVDGADAVKKELATVVKAKK
ncbi:uncharacterized protein LTR77_000258 [Saxophila tyrrhenica]|uniref:Transcription and mRNA export factor SUS1 n=1 Tax=Saxophila tyrrhenica TaxID=1690608 RepID=A0AAV9PMA2_9PEZI|nr:hypothetical protein LTR77_000258 [Saxophila tyrrhenica]